jgi:hypothetical protein
MGRAFDKIEAKRAVLTVGDQGGRGFVVESSIHRLVITAAHCLPRLPVPHPWAQEERTYSRLLGPLGEKPRVTTECWFVDPVSDLAVLGPPDSVLGEENEAYEKLMSSSAALPIARLTQQTPGWLLSLDGEWFRCSVRPSGRGLMVSNASKGILGGMSGSPILDSDGAAIGVISCSQEGPGEKPTEGDPNPRLIHHLPSWLECDLLQPPPQKEVVPGKRIVIPPLDEDDLKR